MQYIHPDVTPVEEEFYNYDFEDDHYDETKVDWPVDLVFWYDTSVEEVYRVY